MGHENSKLRTSAPHPAAQAGLEEWHRIVTERDWDQLPALRPASVVARLGEEATRRMAAAKSPT